MCSLSVRKIYRREPGEVFCAKARNRRIARLSYIFYLTYFYSSSFYFNHVDYN
jgi:hypothetical protein